MTLCHQIKGLDYNLWWLLVFNQQNPLTFRDQSRIIQNKRANNAKQSSSDERNESGQEQGHESLSTNEREEKKPLLTINWP